MTNERFLRVASLSTLLVATTLAPAAAQTPEGEQAPDEEQATFERRYIDASSRRDAMPLLHDWPALTRLVRWSRDLENEIAEADRTISEELLEGFESRVDSLRSGGAPASLGLSPDTVATILDSLDVRLVRARAALDSVPVEVRQTGDEASAGSERDRTLVTGETAVRVPAGIAVGERDTLPTAEIVGTDGPNFVDLMTEALVELDRLVHLVRRSGRLSEEGEAAPAPTRGRGTAPPRGGP